MGASVSRFQRLEGGDDNEEKLGLLGRVPVLPVPCVEASELTVRVRVCSFILYLLFVYLCIFYFIFCI